MIRVICILVGYLFGMFQSAYVYGKINGIDIREHGSGNAGTTNSLRVLGKKAGLIVLLSDGLKCVFAILLVKLLLPEGYSNESTLYCIYTALGAILGHNFPFYMGFKGGKGIAATYGFLLAFDLRIFIVAVIVFFAVFLTSHYVSLGSLVIYMVFFIQLVIFGQLGLLGNIAPGVLYEIYAVGFVMMALAFIKHGENIKRLVKGIERKTYINKKQEK